MTDQAGNSLTLSVRVQDDGHQVHVRIVSLTCTTGTGRKTVTPADNSLDFEWSLDHSRGTLNQVEQQLRVQAASTGHCGPADHAGPCGPGDHPGPGNPGGQQLSAGYDAHQNVTRLDSRGERGKPQTQIGLVLLLMSTSGGQLIPAI